MSETEDLGQLITTLTAESDGFEAERDALQQRIDSALAEIARWESDDGEITLFDLPDLIRTALTGADTDAV